MSDTQAETDPLLTKAEATNGESTAVEDASQAVSSASQPTGADEPEVDVQHIQHILQLEVPVQVILAERKMPLREILSVSIGSIIEFEKPFDEELDLVVNNRCIAYGQGVKVGENFGLRITRIADVRERIGALGPTSQTDHEADS